MNEDIQNIQNYLNNTYPDIQGIHIKKTLYEKQDITQLLFQPYTKEEVNIGYRKVILIETTSDGSFYHATPIIIRCKDNAVLDLTMGLYDSKLYKLNLQCSNVYNTVREWCKTEILKTFGCLELAIATVSKFNGELILEGGKRVDIDDYKEGAFTTEEVLKLSQGTKLFAELKIDQEKLEVTNTKGKKQTLHDYRQFYSVRNEEKNKDQNKLLNILTDTRENYLKGKPIRVNSGRDIKRLKRKLSKSKDQGKPTRYFNDKKSLEFIENIKPTSQGLNV